MADIVFSNQNIMVYLFVVELVINYQICDLRLNLNRACCAAPFCVMRTGIGCIHLSVFYGYSRPGAFLERKRAHLKVGWGRTDASASLKTQRYLRQIVLVSRIEEM